MRDINRIDPLLKKLGEAWKKYPDLRFGQFLSHFFSSFGGDVWNLEEDEWMVAIQAYIDEKNIPEMVDAYQEEKMEEGVRI